MGAGTVEFLLAADGTFYFLEVNARIQVEHPITEACYGVDLVAEQLRVARDEPLDPALATAAPRGWAMEARLYAEDPATGFLPSAGRILDLHLPTGPGIRVDAGVRSGSIVPLEYDPILAKIIAWGPDRESCRQRLVAAMRETAVLGVASNAAFLRDVLGHPAFVEGRTHTQLLEQQIVADLGEPEPPILEVAAIAAALALEGDAPSSAPTPGAPRKPDGPWDLLTGRRFPEGGAS